MAKKASTGERQARKPRTVKIKGTKKGRVGNPCYNAPLELRTYSDLHYGIRTPFTPSNAQLTRYAEHHNHTVPKNYDNFPPTLRFDEDALREVRGRYPADPLYKLIQQYRENEKCLGTYVEGMKPDADGRVRGEYNHKAKTLRLAMRSPSLQVLPRGAGEESPYTAVKGMFEAIPDHTFNARDFSGIEAVIVAYLAHDPALMRLCNIDVHSFVASHAIGQPADLGWSDPDLFGYFNNLKSENRQWKVSGLDGTLDYAKIRDSCKRTLHLSNYGGTPKRMVQAEPDIFPDALVAAQFQDLYFNTFPSIRKWQWAVCEEAERVGYITTPDGFRQHFHDVFQYSYSKREGRWIKSFGEVAKECIAAKPQHLAMLFMALGLIALWEEYPEIAEGCRLSIHDEIFAEWPLTHVESYDTVLKDVMERPNRLMPLPPEWGLGEYLAIRSEAKRGPCWQTMKKVKDVK